jgi:hypothetical protein
LIDSQLILLTFDTPSQPLLSLTLSGNYGIMEENKRQKQVGKLVMEELSDIFQREGMNIIDGGMVSITKVMITPCLPEFLSGKRSGCPATQNKRARLGMAQTTGAANQKPIASHTRAAVLLR